MTLKNTEEIKELFLSKIMKIIKLKEDHYIVVDDSEIKEGDWIGFPNLKKFVPVQYFGGDLTGGEKKITHSTQPLDCACSNKGYKLNTNCAERNRCFDKVQYLPLQEVKELLGIVDVEKKALDLYPVELDEDWDKNKQYIDEWISGYNQALEDNKDRKYTEEDMLTIRNQLIAFLLKDDVTALDKPQAISKCTKWFDECVESLQPQTEWEVEFIDGKLKIK